MCWVIQEYVAIKVIRNVQKYRDAAMIEIDVLRTLAKNDKMGIRSELFTCFAEIIVGGFLSLEAASLCISDGRKLI
jgi:hypothetical protein